MPGPHRRCIWLSSYQKSSNESLAKKLEDFSQGSSSYFFSRPNDTIVTSEDGLFRVLTKHQKKMESRTFWVTPLGILATAVGTLFGVDEFKPILGIPAGGIHAFFLLLSVVCALWLAIYYEAILNYFRASKEEISIDQLIERIKADSEERQQSNDTINGDTRGLTLGTLATLLASDRNTDPENSPIPSNLTSTEQQ